MGPLPSARFIPMSRKIFLHMLFTKLILRDMMYSVTGGIVWTFS